MLTLNPASLTHLPLRERQLFSQHAFGSSSTVPFECVHHAFESHARRNPSVVAVEQPSENTSITYGELDRKANRLARRLRAAGVDRGSRVCIMAKRSVTNVIAIIATLKAGGQYVPLDGDTITDSTLAHILNDTSADLLLCMNMFAHRAPVHVPHLNLEQVINDDEEMDADDSKIDDHSRGTDGVYIIYTSGTTGLPKGVDVAHSGVCNVVLQSPGNVGMQPGMRVASILNIAFDMGAWEHLGSMANGCTLVLRGDRAKHWKAVFETVEVVISTPTILERHDPADYPTIKHVITGGEPCPQDLADRWARYCNFNNCCGPTEISIMNAVQLHTPGEKISIGRPIPNTAVYILDDNCEPTPFGQVGVMWVGGVGVSRGYLNLPQHTAKRYRQDPFLQGDGRMYNTGDLCRWREDGRLEVLGRVDDQVKIKGFRVELDGVSSAMRTCVDVVRSTCLLIDQELWGFYMPAHIPEEEVSKATSKVMPKYAVPTRWLPLNIFPQTRNGKVDKARLRAMAEECLSSSEDTLVDSEESTSTPRSQRSLSVPELMEDNESCPPSPGLADPVTPTLEETTAFSRVPPHPRKLEFGVHLAQKALLQTQRRQQVQVSLSS